MVPVRRSRQGENGSEKLGPKGALWPCNQIDWVGPRLTSPWNSLPGMSELPRTQPWALTPDPSVTDFRAQPPRLLDRVRQAIRARHYSRRTEKAYVWWIKRYIFFHGKRHPDELGSAEIVQFLSSLATRGHVSASTQNQAFSALLFLYREVLGRELAGLEQAVRAKQPERLPVVLTNDEVAAILRRMHGVTRLMASLMYGTGLRLLECAHLRVKDIDFTRGEITVRQGKGGKDRVTILPETLRAPLIAHLQRMRIQHSGDLNAGAGSVELPDALERKYPRAAWEWGWQWVFPATRLYEDRETSRRRRHHLHESVIQRALKTAVREAGLTKPASCHTLRHSFASQLLPTRAAALQRSARDRLRPLAVYQRCTPAAVGLRWLTGLHLSDDRLLCLSS